MAKSLIKVDLPNGRYKGTHERRDLELEVGEREIYIIPMDTILSGDIYPEEVRMIDGYAYTEPFFKEEFPKIFRTDKPSKEDIDNYINSL